MLAGSLMSEIQTFVSSQNVNKTKEEEIAKPKHNQTEAVDSECLMLLCVPTASLNFYVSEIQTFVPSLKYKQSLIL